MFSWSKREQKKNKINTFYPKSALSDLLKNTLLKQNLFFVFKYFIQISSKIVTIALNPEISRSIDNY